MKRSLSILSVFVLFAFLFTFSFAPVVKAETNTDSTNSTGTTVTQQGATTGDQTGTTTDDKSQQGSEQTGQQTEQTNDQAVTQEQAKKEKQYKIRLRFDAKYDEENDTFIPILIAKLIDKTDKEVGQVEGTWTVEVDGKEYKKFENSTDKKIRVELPEEFNSVKVVFEGKIDGQDVKVHKKYEVTNADVEITHKEVNGKDEFTATIKGVENAQGHWFLAYGDEEDMIDFKEGDGGATFTATFDNVKPGKYLVVAVFEGTINDGDYVVLGNTMEFEKKDNGSGEVKPPSDNNGGKKPPVLPPDDTHKQIEEGKKGGKLPKTATTYPVGALAGLVLLFVGFVALKLRRA